MTDPQAPVLSEFETATSVLSGLAWLATRKEGPQRTQTVVMAVQAERVGELLGAAQKLGNGPPRRQRASRLRLARPTEKPAGE